MSDITSVDFTQKTGSELKDYITPQHKFKIIIKSIPYNSRGAYWAFENTYINIGKDIYNKLTKPGKVIDLYVHYYNFVKLNNEKDSNAPGNITPEMIDCIRIDRLPLNYVEYYMR